MNWTTHEQTLTISLQSFDFNPDLLKSPKKFKRLCLTVTAWKLNFWFAKRHNNGLDLANKNFFFNNYTVDIFSVCYCYYFISGYINSFVYNIQTH